MSSIRKTKLLVYQVKLAASLQWITSEHFHHAMEQLQHLPQNHEDFLSSQESYQKLFQTLENHLFLRDAYDLLMRYDYFPRNYTYEQRINLLTSLYPSAKKRYIGLREKAREYQKLLGHLEHHLYSLDELLARNYSPWDVEEIAQTYEAIASHLTELTSYYHRDHYFASLNDMIERAKKKVLVTLAEELSDLEMLILQPSTRGYLIYLEDLYTSFFGASPSEVLKQYSHSSSEKINQIRKKKRTKKS